MAGLHFGSRGGGDADPASGTFMASTMQDFDSGFSVRRLRQGYLGSAMRVQRHSDDAELDIGFLPNGWLDVFSLLEFAGAGTASVKTWYDQGASATNGVMTTRAKQPVIVSSGVLQLKNGHPALRFTDTAITELAGIDLPLLDVNNLSVFSVLTFEVAAASGNPRAIVTREVADAFGSFRYGLRTNDNNPRIDLRPSTAMGTYAGVLVATNVPGAAPFGQQVQTSILFDSAPSAVNDKTKFYGDGSLLTNSTPSSATPATETRSSIGSHGLAGTTFHGTMQEIVYWKSLKTAQRAEVENNQAGFFIV